MFHVLQSLLIFVCKLWFYTTIVPIIFLYSLVSSTSKLSKKASKCAKHATQDTNTVTVKHRFTHQWTIEHFGGLVGANVDFHNILSPKFSPPEKISSKLEEKLQFQIVVYTNSDRREPDHIGHIGVFLRVTTEKQIKIRYRFAAIDSRNRRKIQTKSDTTMFNPGEAHGRGYLKWIKHEELFNAEKGYLSKESGNFTILCKIKFSISKPLSTLDMLAPTQKLSKATFKQNFKAKMLDNSNFSDISLVVAGGKVLKAHKAILAAQSPVFEAMFSYTNTKEALEKRVEIPDLTEQVCRELLRFVYTGKIKNMEQFAEQLYSAADKYQLDHLKLLCEATLCTKLTPENAKRIHQLAYLHNSFDLMQKAFQLIDSDKIEEICK